MIEKLVIGWLINYVIAAVTRWLDQNAPTQVKRDPKPAPIIKPKRRPKYVGIPGFDPDTGTWRANAK